VYYLFLDDVREPKHVKWVELPRPVSWIIVRSYPQFVEAVSQKGLPGFVSFDYELGDEIYGKSSTWFTEKTGRDCAEFMVKYCENNMLPFPQYAVHSMSPTGKADIIQTIERYKNLK